MEWKPTARYEFERLLKADPDALCFLPTQHMGTVESVLSEFGLTLDHARGIVANFALTVNPYQAHSMGSEITWEGLEAFDQYSDRARAALCLAALMLWLRDGAPQFVDAPFAARLIIHREVLRLFWTALVVPELHAEGVSISQRKRRTNTDIRSRARELWGTGRYTDTQLVDRLKTEYDHSKTWVNRVVTGELKKLGVSRSRKKK